MSRSLGRRSALKAIGAVAGVGSLAGCTERLPDGLTTFQATPAFFQGVQEDAPVSANPTRILANASVTRAGLEFDVEATSFAITQVIGPNLVDLGPEPQLPDPPILGELFVFSTPTVSLPGIGDLNPVKNLTPERVVEAIGGSATGSFDYAEGRERDLPTIRFGDLPSGGNVVKSGYRGWVNEVTDSSLERHGDNGVSGTATLELKQGTGEPAGGSTSVEAILVGGRLQHGNDHLIMVGWSPKSVVDQHSNDGALTVGNSGVDLATMDRMIQGRLWGASGDRVLRLTHPSTCPDGDCVRFLQSAFERVDFVFPSAQSEIEVGDRVADTATPDPDPAVAIAVPEDPISNWLVFEDETVAYQNPTYDPLERVVVVTYERILDDNWTEWNRMDLADIYDGVIDRGIKFYAFPHARLEPER